MKIKIVFMIINMNIGGTEKALLNMIAEMPEDEYDITILMLEKYGGFLDSIPNTVHIDYILEYPSLKNTLNQPAKVTAINLFKTGKLIKGLGLTIATVLAKTMKNKSLFFHYLLKNVPIYKNEYDVAVAYAGPMDFISYFVVHKIKARKKIQWIHFDVTKIGFDVNFAAKTYKKFERFFVVSEEARSKLVSLVPVVEEKSEVFINLVSPNLIRTKSKEGKGFNDGFNGIKILTVGRLATEKGQDLAIRVLSRLIDDGYDVKWYCLGEGSYRSEYEGLIKELKLQDRFILLGPDSNPYPYMDQCDIYVQPSRYEGYCITLIEARCLAKPIVTTNVNGAKEQIENGETGLIVNIDEKQIYNGVKELIDNPKLCQEFSDNLSKYPFENTQDMSGFAISLT
ncbi:glycosyltransferase [Oceanobacillus arenosus]|uniref:Glycosyltransferase n=1 Tax=Oceanobacillus arenosus TaxID=1229153 RepID=A0A3D8Q3Q8_9BACI|nr:glycosyltransferase [Oceanobacillus arenosus]RDW22399.1 glycosyltransferase [Oceanobacillus arenosus]